MGQVKVCLQYLEKAGCLHSHSSQRHLISVSISSTSNFPSQPITKFVQCWHAKKNQLLLGKKHSMSLFWMCFLNSFSIAPLSLKVLELHTWCICRITWTISRKFAVRTFFIRLHDWNLLAITVSLQGSEFICFFPPSRSLYSDSWLWVFIFSLAIHELCFFDLLSWLNQEKTNSFKICYDLQKNGFFSPCWCVVLVAIIFRLQPERFDSIVFLGQCHAFFFLKTEFAEELDWRKSYWIFFVLFLKVSKCLLSKIILY